MKRFNKRKTWWFSNHRKSISIETSGWKSHPSLYFRVNGDEGDCTFHFALGFGIWITFEGFIPNSWYPTYKSTYTEGLSLYDERQLSISFHGGSFWWDFWVSENKSQYTKYKTWRKGCWHIVDRIRGKHECSFKEVDRREFAIPFLEGNYNLLVIKKDRTDTWKRWPKKKMTSFEVKCGYYQDGEWIDKGVPVEGKGENSWDCDEDATYSMHFPGAPYRKEVRSCYDAALYFWHSMMKSRERYGSAQWLPEKFKNKKLEVIKN